MAHKKYRYNYGLILNFDGLTNMSYVGIKNNQIG